MEKQSALKQGILPVKFPQATKNLIKPNSMTDEECASLWVWNDGQTCISCWKLNLWQRLQILFTGKIWLGIMSGQTQPPVWLDSDNVFSNN